MIAEVRILKRPLIFRDWCITFMIKIHDKEGNLIEVQLEKGEQLYLMKENQRLMKSAPKNNLWNKRNVIALSSRKEQQK